jgi:hypothetical protein
MGPLGVVDDLEGVDLFLEFGDRCGQRLLVEPAEQGLVKAFRGAVAADGLIIAAALLADLIVRSRSE